MHTGKHFPRDSRQILTDDGQKNKMEQTEPRPFVPMLRQNNFRCNLSASGGYYIYMNQEIISFHELYSRYAEDVYRFSCWLTGNADEAKDITSETFVRVWLAKNDIRIESVKAYLFAIARNLWLKDKRRKNRFSPAAKKTTGK